MKGRQASSPTLRPGAARNPVAGYLKTPKLAYARDRRSARRFSASSREDRCGAKGIAPTRRTDLHPIVGHCRLDRVVSNPPQRVRPVTEVGRRPLGRFACRDRGDPRERAGREL